MSLDEKQERAYWTHEVAKILSIGESTLRKWCIELEKNGYIFIKGVKDSRAFTDHDIKALTYFKELMKVHNKTKEEASDIVSRKFSRKEVNEGTTPVPMEYTRSDDVLHKKLDEVLKELNTMKQINIELLKRLDNREQLIDKLIEQQKEENRLLIEEVQKSRTEQSATKEEKGFIEKMMSLFKK